MNLAALFLHLVQLMEELEGRDSHILWTICLVQTSAIVPLDSKGVWTDCL